MRGKGAWLHLAWQTSVIVRLLEVVLGRSLGDKVCVLHAPYVCMLKPNVTVLQ